MFDNKERRNFARLCVGVEAVYQRKNGEDKAEKKVLVRNISISGMRFIADEPLEREKLLLMRLVIPSIPVPINVEVKVVWQRIFSESFFDTGAEFVDFDYNQQEALSAYIQGALGKVVEQREFVRTNLSTTVHYKIDEHTNGKCVSVDISPSGLKVFIKEKLQKGTKMQLVFNIPDEKEPLSVEGQVIWLRDREERFIETGVEFTKINAADAEKIDKYVKKSLGLDW
ncbi:MAG: PilZ domain-containing protein [Candidatus Omnitrophota bacterium]